jgi:translation initiation factor 2B subunit (eIF-2B alpha/beta/delta family)
MKNLKNFAFTFLLSIPTIFFAQTAIKGESSLVNEGERVMSQGNKNSLAVNLTKTNAKFAEKVWKDYSKQFKGSYKKDKKNDEYFTDNANISAIGGGNTVDLFMKFVETGENTTATLWIDLGGAFVGSKEFKDKYMEAEKLMAEYALKVARDQTQIQLKEQQDAQKDMEKAQKKLEDKNKDLVKDIEDWKKKILKAEQDIIANQKAQEDTKAKIETQKKVVDEVQKKLNALN